MSRSGHWLGLAIIALLVGCGDKSSSDSEPPRRSAALSDREGPARAGAAVEPAFHLLSTELVSPGDGPRRTLRYRRSTGLTRTVSRAAIDATSRSGATTTTDRGSIETGLAITPRADGCLDVAGLPGATDIDGSLERYRRLVSGASAVAEVDDRGRLVAMTGPAGIDSKRELAAMLIRHLVPLPDEPVAVGARWRVKYALGRGGVFVAHRIELELVRADGDELAVKIAVRESAEPQPIRDGGRAVADLLALATTATGVLEISLDNPLAQSGSMTVETTFHARATRGELLRESKTKLALASELVSKR